MTEPGPGEFRCEACGGVFGKVLSDAEERAQFAREFPGLDRDTTPGGMACEDCYQAMKAWGLFEIPIDQLR